MQSLTVQILSGKVQELVRWSSRFNRGSFPRSPELRSSIVMDGRHYGARQGQHEYLRSPRLRMADIVLRWVGY